MSAGRYEFNTDIPVLGTLESCENVIDRNETHNHLTGVLTTDEAAATLEYALSKINSEDRNFLAESIDCSELGLELTTECVPTTSVDQIVFAHRLGRRYATRFVLERQPEPTNHVTAILRRDTRRSGIMVLISAYPGERGGPEPWNARPSEMAESLAYWRTHALIWDPSSVDFTKPFGRVEDHPELNFENYLQLDKQ